MTDIPITGVRHARLDSSLRLHIGADWHTLAGDSLYLFASAGKYQPHITALTAKSYEAKMQNIISHDKLTPAEKSDRAHLFAMLAIEVKVDSRNRILVPNDLAVVAGLEKSGMATLVGRGDHFTIWEASRHKESQSSEEAGC